jgi:hypothetical protein
MVMDRSGVQVLLKYDFDICFRTQNSTSSSFNVFNMVGTIKQQLYISGLPQGMTLRVTALNLLPPDPPKEWRATLYTASGTERVSYLCQLLVK